MVKRFLWLALSGTGILALLGAVLFATGGYVRLYRNNSNALINTGDGVSLAMRAGLPVEDIEFVQFHPTGIYGVGNLITEGARGEGAATVHNRHGPERQVTHERIP